VSKVDRFVVLSSLFVAFASGYGAATGNLWWSILLGGMAVTNVVLRLLPEGK
jgi:hypothetical protein